ncbi:hypothetical protein ACE38W_08600 [Chitinophaga sp. Hz27]|uniref:hypothetical protein n=1 Tax=Chitinophaga sp. Hz27 TaxID=3347169 RepID=UPI0035E0CCDB
MTTEANINITKENGKITAISVLMPIWTKWNDFGHLSIQIPLLGLEALAQNDEDAEVAIEEATISFCVIAEKFGGGKEKELEVLGWKSITNSQLEYDIDHGDILLQGIFKACDNYVNPHLKLELAA